MANMLRGGKYTEESPQVGHANDPDTSERHEHLLRTQGCIVDTVNDHLNPDRKTKVETAASGFAIPGILSHLDESIGNWVSVAFYSRKSRFASLPNRIPHGIGYPSSIIAPTLTSQVSATTWRLLEGRSRMIRARRYSPSSLVTSAMACVCESWLCIQDYRLQYP
jgi:hypothetical protein